MCCTASPLSCWHFFITPLVILVSIFLFYLFFNRSIPQPTWNGWSWPWPNSIQSQVASFWGNIFWLEMYCLLYGCPLSHSIWRTSISLALSLCILTWIIPHGLNVTNATPHSIYSVAPGNPCKLSEINVSFVPFFAADSFRPFILYVSVDFATPF